MSGPRADGWRVLVRPDGYVPFSERVLPRHGRSRWLVIALFAIAPIAQMLAIWSVGRAAGVVTVGLDALAPQVPGRFIDMYLVVLTLWAAGHIAARLADVRRLVPEDIGPAADWRTWLVPPLVFMVMFSAANEIDRIGALPNLGAGRLATAAASVLFEIPIRLSQASAFWTVVVALLAIARMRRLPGTFPEDRTLGLRPVGALLTTALLLYAAAFTPSFLFGVERLADLVLTSLIFGLGLGAMVLALWRLHESMVEERVRQVEGARQRYARAYRDVAAGSQSRALEARAVELQASTTLLQGAESIFEWPFDERMQRVAAIVVTGVITGLVVRLILFALGI